MQKRRQLKVYLGAGPATLEEIKANVQVRPESLIHLLDHMVAKGKLSKSGDNYDLV